jgi:RNA polymerase sigma-70 factor (ECF subfamily)
MEDGELSAEERFAQMVRTHRPALVLHTSRLVGGDTARAEDIVQETFTRAWRRIDHLAPEHGSVNGWLHRVAHNVAIDHHRMRLVRPTEVELQDLDVEVLADGADDVVLSMAVRDLLGSIWPEHQAVLIEVYLNDRTAAQAAQVLGIPVGTVKSRLHHALRRLRSAAAQNDLQAS